MSEMTEAAQAVEPVLDKASELILEGIDTSAEYAEIARHNVGWFVAVASVGVLVGAAGGYFIAKKRLSAFYEQLATEEIADAKAFYSGVYKIDESGAPVTPQEIFEQKHGVEAAAEALRTYQGQIPDEDGYIENEDGFLVEAQDEAQMQKMEQEHFVEKPAVVIEEKVESRNVFIDSSFDLEEELKHRTEDRPYIITHDEYYAAEKEYETSSLTYFEIDDTLVDEQDKPMEGIDALIGDETLVRFGQGSMDRNIVYVRNDRLGTDFEVIKSTGSYLEEVLGMPEDPGSLKHSGQRDRRRAFRHGDE